MPALEATLLATALTGALLLMSYLLQSHFERHEQRQWARRGRFLPWAEVAAASSKGEGTLIPAGRRVWWTPTKLDPGAYEPYLAAGNTLEGGPDNVYLSDPPKGMKDARSLRRAFPLATVFEPREAG